MARRKPTYREAEDPIRYYAPARYLCGLTETEWTPDHTTIRDFTELMGEEGNWLITQYVVELAVKAKLADPRTIVADTTAREAAVPYPNEIGLMGDFITAVAAASRKVGTATKGFVKKTVSQFTAATRKPREYRLFAKSQESKKKVMGQLATIVEKVNEDLEDALKEVSSLGGKLHRHALVAPAKFVQLQQTMSRLLPRIRSWLRTGRVASGKIISLFGEVPHSYAYDRGGYESFRQGCGR